MKFTVSRKKWLRGKNWGALFIGNAMKCCLGFVGQQCGIPTNAMHGKATPRSLGDDYCGKFPAWIQQSSASAVDINDEPNLSDRDRETKLKDLFKKHGDQIVFKP